MEKLCIRRVKAAFQFVRLQQLHYTTKYTKYSKYNSKCNARECHRIKLWERFETFFLSVFFWLWLWLCDNWCNTTTVWHGFVDFFSTSLQRLGACRTRTADIQIPNSFEGTTIEHYAYIWNLKILDFSKPNRGEERKRTERRERVRFERQIGKWLEI